MIEKANATGAWCPRTLLARLPKLESQGHERGDLDLSKVHCGKTGFTIPSYAITKLQRYQMEVSDRMFIREDFLKIQKLSKMKFHVDACSAIDGSNAHCNVYYSRNNSFLQANVQGLLSWINSPFNILEKTLAHYVANKLKNPSTGACILVPGWKNSKWRQYLNGMELLCTYPPGTRIFSEPTPTGGRELMQGVPWPIEIWIDRPRTNLNQGVVLYNNVSKEHAGGESMTFTGTVQGQQVRVLIDSGAADTCGNTRTLEALGLQIKPTLSVTVKLADGSLCPIKGRASVPLKAQDYKETMSFLVTELGEDYDLILGNPWLLAHEANLKFEPNNVRTVLKSMVAKR